MQLMMHQKVEDKSLTSVLISLDNCQWDSVPESLKDIGGYDFRRSGH